jgi:hypothetical protein
MRKFTGRTRRADASTEVRTEGLLGNKRRKCTRPSETQQIFWENTAPLFHRERPLTKEGKKTIRFYLYFKPS